MASSRMASSKIQSRRVSTESVIKEWEGYCLDDGTGQNVYFMRNDGFQSRQMPEGFEYELHKNGERKYYNRGIV